MTGVSNIGEITSICYTFYDLSCKELFDRIRFKKLLSFHSPYLPILKELSWENEHFYSVNVKRKNEKSQIQAAFNTVILKYKNLSEKWLQFVTNCSLTSNFQMLNKASENWVFLHLLPRWRGDVSEEVFNHKNSLVWTLHENIQYSTMVIANYLISIILYYYIIL